MGRSPPTPSTHTRVEVVHESPAEALALITVVDDADRAEFEESLGTEIRDEVDGGPAGRRDQYYVVTRVTPMTETNKVLVGVDLSMDPVRSDAIERALASGETVISAPLGSLPTGRPAVFVAKPLYRPGADGSPRMEEPVGLVTTGYQGLRLLEEITAQLPSGTRLELRDGDAVLAVTDPPPESATARDLSVGDREWTVAVSPRHAIDYLPAWLVGLTGAVVLGALALVLLRGARYESRLRTGTEAMGTLADLSQELAVATDVDDLARAVSRHVPAIVGAELAGVAVVERAEGRVRLLPNSSLPADLTATFGEIDLGTASPVAAAARDGEVLLLGDQDAIKTGMLPQEAGALAASGFSAVGVAPLTVEGSVAAIVGVAWRSKKPVDAAQETGLRTVSEVCTRTLERIEAARVIVERETGLATLARKLSTAATHDDVTGVMFAEARRVVGAFHANVGMLEPGGGALLTKGSMLPEDVAQRQRRLPLDAGLPLTDAILRNETVLLEDLGAMQARYSDIVDDARASGFAALAALPLHDTAGTPMGVLSMAWSAPLRVDAALRSTLHTVADMAAQTYERVDLADERVREGDLNRRLADVGERLATAGSTEEVVATLAASAADVVGARSAAVGVLDTGRGILHMVDDERQEGWTTSLSDLPQDPAARAVDSRAGVVSEGSPDDAADGGTVVAEPLLDHRRQPVGALRVTFAPEEVVAPRARRAVRRLAEMAAQALERASITDAEHRRTSLLAAYATELERGAGGGRGHCRRGHGRWAAGRRRRGSRGLGRRRA